MCRTFGRKIGVVVGWSVAKLMGWVYTFENKALEDINTERDQESKTS